MQIGSGEIRGLSGLKRNEKSNVIVEDDEVKIESKLILNFYILLPISHSYLTYPIYVDIVLKLTRPTGKYRAQAQIGDMPMLDVGIDVKVDGIEFTTAATTTAIQNLKIWPTPPIQIEDIEVSNIF